MIRYFDDPFVHETRFLIEQLRRQGDRGGAFRSVAEFHSLLISLAKFSGYHLSTGFLLSNFDELEPAMEKIFEFYRLSQKRARKEANKARLEATEQELRRAFERLQHMRNILTPSHIAVQEHFWAFVLGVPRNRLSDNMKSAEFLEPLYKLRDEFFLGEAPVDIEHYLAVAEQLQSDRFYLEHIINEVDPEELAEAQANVEEKVIKLVTLSLTS